MLSWELGSFRLPNLVAAITARHAVSATELITRISERMLEGASAEFEFDRPLRFLASHTAEELRASRESSTHVTLIYFEDRFELAPRIRELDAHLAQILNAELLRWLPLDPKRGTVAELLASGGGWLTGCAFEVDGTRLEFLDAHLRVQLLHPERWYASFGFRLVHTLANGEKRPFELTMTDPSYKLTWRDRPTSARARPQLEQFLRANFEKLSSSPGDLLHEMMSSLFEPPAERSLFAFVARLLHNCFGNRDWGHGLRTESAAHLTAYGSAHLDLVEGDRVVRRVWFGELSARARILEVSDEVGVELAAQWAVFEEWLRVQVAHPPRADEVSDFFPILELLEHRLVDGPPGPLPVPRLDASAYAAHPLNRVDSERRRAIDVHYPTRASAPHRNPIAAFEVAGHTIILVDELRRTPLGNPSIDLWLAGAPEPMSVCGLSDYLGGNLARWVIDGAPFALRRFLEWLRGAIHAGDLDERVQFGPVPSEEVDDDSVVPQSILLTDWLCFGIPPEHGDRFLIDWRFQWHVAQAQPPSGSPAEVAAWRRFLCEVVHPGFSDALAFDRRRT